MKLHLYKSNNSNKHSSSNSADILVVVVVVVVVVVIVVVVVECSSGTPMALGKYYGQLSICIGILFVNVCFLFLSRCVFDIVFVVDWLVDQTFDRQDSIHLGGPVVDEFVDHDCDRQTSRHLGGPVVDIHHNQLVY